MVVTESRRLVFLVPGFFGFTSVGSVSYFERVEQTLGDALRRHGAPARIVRCKTQPTASIPRRVDALRRQVLARGGLKASELHFVGHSTGGLDMRMLLTPGVKISRGDSEDRIARLTRSAISVATPHHGTPLANHFLSLQGQTLLLVLSALATSGQGRGAIVAAAQALALVARLDDWLGRKTGPLDRLLETSRYKPSSELLFHLALYRKRQDIEGIVHTHSVYATTLATLAAMATGNFITGNSYYGVHIFNSVENKIYANVISRNGSAAVRAGVRVEAGEGFDAARNTILSNSIYQNSGLGIELVGGANQYISQPHVTYASCGRITIMASSGYTVQIFSDREDEGRVLEATLLAPSGDPFDWTGRITGPYVTITQTSPAGNTSIFSAPLFACSRGFLPVIMK